MRIRRLHRRERLLASMACLLLLSFGFVWNMGKYHAREIRAFIAESEKKQGDGAWLLQRAAQRRSKRMQQRSVGSLPPAGRDARVIAVQADARPSAGMPPSDGVFPAFGHAQSPVSVVPDWGAMRSPEEWDRPFSQMPQSVFVLLPAYDLKTLQIPLESLTHPIRPASIPVLTAKLTYSTRYYGAYDLDAGEYSGRHPGIDLKLAFGTPVGSLGGGKVQSVTKEETGLGLSVIVEHRLNGEKIFSVYGHLDTAWVQEGETVQPGQIIGTVGLSGRSTAPHLHFQIDRDDGSLPHQPFWPPRVLTAAEASEHTLHPIHVIEQYRTGVSE